MNKPETKPKMAISVPKRRSKQSKKVNEGKLCLYGTVFFKILYRIPAAIFLIFLLFLWLSSTSIISGRFIHVCVSSRKLSNLYCISAGSQPNYEIPIQAVNNSSFNSSSNGVQGYIQEIVEASAVSQPVASVSNNGSVSAESVKENQPDVEDQLSHEKNDLTDSPAKPDVKVKENQSDVEVQISNEKNDLTNSPAKPDVKVSDDVPHDQYSAGVSPITRSDDEKDGKDEDEIARAMEAIEEQLRQHRSWMWVSPGNDLATECDGRGIYVYELPAKFNKDLVAQCQDMVPWMDFCNYFSNEALGEPIPKLGKGWHQTHQYSLEPIFHSRVLRHRCRVYNEDEAKLFCVPYYGGLNILRWHFKNVSNAVKDTLGLELVQWLATQRPWTRNSGKDHVFVLGKISWDFRRSSGDGSSWGTNFLELNQMQNPIKLLIERQPWHENDIGIPHPTFFHPHSDDDIFAWQWKTLRSDRKHLVGFAGAARPDDPDNIRSMLINHCASSSAENGSYCRHVDCTSVNCEQPETVIELFLESEFCLQPPGDSPTRKSVFDSLISGCIPVFFDPFTAYYQYPWHLPEDYSKYSVLIDKKELQKSKENVVKKLMEISPAKRAEMRSYIVYELLPGLVYGDSNNELEKFQDAFSIAINNLLQMVSKL